jgi:pimeloyl-ACP methyl ester carboxylesterase
VIAPSLPVIVLVHGAWHGAWCWAGLQAEFDRRGLASYAVDLPGHGASTEALTDLYGDADHVVATLTALERPVVLVGHSYGGAVITEAASRRGDDIVHLVYLTAFALEQGESIMTFLAAQPPAPGKLGASIVMADDGTSSLDPISAVAALYADCPPKVIDAAVARLSPQPMATFTQEATGSPRDTIASTYVRCTRDEAIHIDHQDPMATRCTATVTLECDHSPFVSRVSETADLLEQIVRSAR